jgi:hypothetical protein
MDKREINETIVMLLEQAGREVSIDRDGYLMECEGVETPIRYDRARIPGGGPKKYSTLMYWGYDRGQALFRRYVKRDGTFPFEEVVEFIQKRVAQINDERKQEDIQLGREKQTIKTLEDLGVEVKDCMARFGDIGHIDVCPSGSVSVKIQLPANSPIKLKKVVKLLRAFT